MSNTKKAFGHENPDRGDGEVFDNEHDGSHNLGLPLLGYIIPVPM